MNYYIFPLLTIDRDQTVSQRSEPSSRTFLMDEQSNPWEPLLSQDKMNRHRGALPASRCELPRLSSLLSLAYLLSIYRCTIHSRAPGHYVQRMFYSEVSFRITNVLIYHWAQHFIISNDVENHQAHVKYTSVILLKVAAPAKLPPTSFYYIILNYVL